MSDWEYWKEPGFPAHKNCCNGWNGVDSDPDHCVTRCEEVKAYLLGTIARLRAELDAAKKKADEYKIAWAEAMGELRYIEDHPEGLAAKLAQAKARACRGEK